MFYYGISFLTASLKNGVGDFGTNYFENLFRTLGVQYICINAIFAFGLLALYLSFSTISAVLAVVITPMIISILSMINAEVDALRYFSFQSTMDSAWLTLPDHFWLKTAAAACMTIIACCVISLSAFKKRDL